MRNIKTHREVSRKGMSRLRKERKKLGFKEMWVHPDLQGKVQKLFDKTFKE